MRKATVIILGAGQAGLAMSRQLSARSIDHVLLERGEVANSWRTERWDSLRLLTPNWQSRLPDYKYTGDNPDGYRDMTETVRFMADYATAIDAPVETNTTVLSVAATETCYTVRTDRGDWTAKCVVIATGACNIASVPAASREASNRINQITPQTYKNPDQLDQGGVLIVGASATGVQLAKEIHESGRPVTLAVGEHVRAPRTYRGRDIKWWMDASGVLDTDLTDVDDVNRVRNVPSMQLIGTPSRETIDLNSLQASGIRIAGRLAGLNDTKAQFSGALANVCRLADLKMNRLLASIDTWADAEGLSQEIETRQEFAPTNVPQTPPLEMDLRAAGVRTILWATGYRPDYSWLDVPILDRKGRLRHRGGIVDAAGLYVLGLPFLRRRKSSLIDGVGDDAADLATHLTAYLAGEQARAA